MNTKDQHSPETIQLKVWISHQMKRDFFDACRASRITPSAELRRLMLNYIMANKNALING